MPSTDDANDVKQATVIKEERFRFRDNPYTLFVLILVLLAKMTNQWHRKFLGYAFGYSAPGDLSPEQHAFYEIGASYP